MARGCIASTPQGKTCGTVTNATTPSGLTDHLQMITKLKTLLGGDERTVDKCPECGAETNPGANRCAECVGDFEDGATVVA